MAAKKTTVLLVVPEHGIQQDFAVEHAERLLRMPHNGGWTLPKGSPFEFDGISLQPKAEPESKTKKKKS